MDERRQHSRHTVRIPVEAIPLTGDGRPYLEAGVPAVCIDVSAEGLCLEWEELAAEPPEAILVRHADPVRGEAFAGLELRHRGQGTSSRIAAGGRFGGPGERILENELILPQLDVQAQRYTLPYPAPVIEAWCGAGVLSEVLLDRVLVCPRCHTLPTFRNSCRQCLSGRVDDRRNVHHFACGHIGPLESFERHDELICPKCRSRRLIVGTDFEYLYTYECRDCHWSESELEHAGHCLACNHRFPVVEAHAQDLIGYRRHAKRFDALAYVAQL